VQRLVSSSEAAKILNISLQGIHYRIKTGKLKAKKKDGKTFVYIDDTLKPTDGTTKENIKNIEDILVVKDEQILFLKKSLKWMKKQYISEIKRLEHNQNKMMKVFQSEIDLLQSAFNEMKKVYQLKDKSDTHHKIEEKLDFGMMDIKDFFLLMKENNKSDAQIKAIILDRVKKGDRRFIFKKETKEVIIYKSDFIDLI
jgi:hypothetical protein